MSALLTTVIPGADRNRKPAAYQFRPTYRGREDEPGCVMAWEVTGGRTPYQIAVERKPDGKKRWHCTCADAVYRGEHDLYHECKHVRGLRDGLADLLHGRL